MKQREPMIGRESRPSLMEDDTPLSELKVRDLAGMIRAEIEIIKPETSKPESSKPELSKPERYKPEWYKPEQIKPEGYKPEWHKPEQFKPEWYKPEQMKPELSKSEDKFDLPEQMIERIALRTAEILTQSEYQKSMVDEIASRVFDALKTKTVAK